MVQENQLYGLAIILAGSVRKLFEGKGIRFSSKPTLEKKPIIEFMRRMRIFGMEKFNNPTFVSTINYYLNIKELKKRSVWGLIAIYVEQDNLASLMRLLQYPQVDDEDAEGMKDACGALCNLIGGQFRIDLLRHGYTNLEMSHFSSYLNRSTGGVEFYDKIREKYEINFYIKREKRLVVEIAMGPIPKIQPREKRFS